MDKAEQTMLENLEKNTWKILKDLRKANLPVHELMTTY